MAKISDYVCITKLGDKKDYQALEKNAGFVSTNETSLASAINPESPAEFIAYLEFLPDSPRGNHYHKEKTEYMIVLKGRLKCNFWLNTDPSERQEAILQDGQMARILPGCVHTFTAQNNKVIALEYSPQKFTLSDIFEIN